jgi:drug/metabolite transporter (DMT)-like permease
VALVGLLGYVVFPFAGFLAVYALRKEPRKWIGLVGLALAIGGLVYVVVAPPAFQCTLPHG